MCRVFVVLAPRDRNKQQLFRTATSAIHGSYRLTDIAPGNYDHFGLDRNGEDVYRESGYLVTPPSSNPESLFRRRRQRNPLLDRAMRR